MLSRDMARSHKRAMRSLCVEMSTSAPCAACSARMSMTGSALMWSRAEVGSSARMSDGVLEDQEGEGDALLLATIAAIQREPYL